MDRNPVSQPKSNYKIAIYNKNKWITLNNNKGYCISEELLESYLVGSTCNCTGTLKLKLGPGRNLVLKIIQNLYIFYT